MNTENAESNAFQELCDEIAIECLYKDFAELSDTEKSTVREVASDVILEDVNDHIAEMIKQLPPKNQ